MIRHLDVLEARYPNLATCLTDVKWLLNSGESFGQGNKA